MPRFPTFDSVAGTPGVCPGTYKLFKDWGSLRLWQDGRVQLTTTGYNDANRGSPPLGYKFEIVSSTELDRPLYTAAGEVVRKAELSRTGSTMLLLDYVTDTACALAYCHYDSHYGSHYDSHYGFHAATWVHESALPVPNAPVVRLAAFLRYLDGEAGFEFRYRKEEHTYLNIGKRM